jgi:hypothetical protein
MASLSDILSSAQNLVTAVNTAFQSYLSVQGKLNHADISSATLVQQGPGRVCMVVVLVAGSTVGAIYDANASASTSNKIYVIPMTVGVVFLNMPVTSGIVVAPGTGQHVAISYS